MPEITEQQHYELATVLANVPPLPKSTYWLRQADALLPLLAHIRAEAKGEALREAADVADAHAENCPDGCDTIACAFANRVTAKWLRGRAEASGREGEL